MARKASTSLIPPLGEIRFTTWFMLIVLLIFALAPVLTEITGTPFYLSVATRLIILSIAAVSLNLVLGYGGMVSFGHAAFIGLGAYAVGIPFYYDITNGFLQFGLAIVVSALFALVTGAICLRTKGVYFIMITMAFGQMVYFTFLSLNEYGADDGLSIYKLSQFPGPIDFTNKVQLYYVCFASLIVSLFIVHRLVNSRFGMAIRGAKGNEERMRAIGFNTYAYRLTCYVISGAMCGFSGALLANFTNFLSPEMIDWTRSGELMFMVIFGGTGTLFGPFLGTAVFLGFYTFLAQFTTYWQLWLGVLILISVLFVKGGINGLIDKIEGVVRKRPVSAPAATPAEAKDE